MSTSAGPPPPPGGGPNKDFGHSHKNSQVYFAPNGDGSSAQRATFSITLIRDSSQKPQFVIAPMMRGEPWLRTNIFEARQYAESGRQVFRGNTLEPVTQWDPPLRGDAPNTAFYTHNEQIVGVERRIEARGGRLPEENVMGNDNFRAEAPDASFGGSIISSGTSGDVSSYGRNHNQPSVGERSVISPIRSSPLRPGTSGDSPGTGPSATGIHSRQASNSAATTRRGRGFSTTGLQSSALGQGSAGSGSRQDLPSPLSPSASKGKGRRDGGSGDRSPGRGAGTT